MVPWKKKHYHPIVMKKLPLSKSNLHHLHQKPPLFIQGLGHPPPNLKKSVEVLLLLAPHQFQGDDTPMHQVEFGRMQIIFIMQAFSPVL